MSGPPSGQSVGQSAGRVDQRGVPLGASSVPDVVFAYFRVAWQAARARGTNFAQDRLAEALTATPRVERLVIADPFRGWLAIARDPTGGRGAPAIEDPRLSHLRPGRWRRRDPTDARSLEHTYRVYDRLLGREVRRRGLRQPAVISSNPLLMGFAPMAWAGPVTFYATDDWTAHHGHAPWQDAYRVAFERIRERGARVVSVSPAIVERLGSGAPTAVVPNGVAEDEWLPRPAPAPEVAALPRPRLIYAGTLDSRIDLELVEATADRYPEGSLVFVGDLAEPAHFERLRRRPNVHIWPRMPRSQVAAATVAADAAFIPHARTALTRAMSPLKLYEALAAGVPVAAVDLEPMRHVSDRVVLSAEGTDFTRAVADALALGHAGEDERADFVVRNSWRRRHDDILDLALRR